MSSKFILECLHVAGSDALSLTQHHHIYYEIIYVRQGTMHLTLDSRPYRITANTLVLINPYEQHSISTAPEAFERYYLMIDPNNFDQFINNPTLAAFFRSGNQAISHIIPAPDCCHEIFQEICDEYNSERAFMDEFISCKVKELLVHVFRANPECFEQVNSTSFQTACKVAAYLENNYWEDLLISDVASNFFVDKHHLSHIFKSVFGCSPKMYLQRTRLLHAKILLLNSSLDLASIAAQTGFPDSNALIKSFRKEEGTTPGRFRKSGTDNGVLSMTEGPEK